MPDHIVVLVTAPNSEEAESLAKLLLEKQLAACCNLLSGVRSLYRWEGKIADDQEVLLLIKTRADLFDRLKVAVLAVHSYSCPEIIALPVVAGHAPYLKWIDDNTLPDKV